MSANGGAETLGLAATAAGAGAACASFAPHEEQNAPPAHLAPQLLQNLGAVVEAPAMAAPAAGAMRAEPAPPSRHVVPWDVVLCVAEALFTVLGASGSMFVHLTALTRPSVRRTCAVFFCWSTNSTTPSAPFHVACSTRLQRRTSA